MLKYSRGKPWTPGGQIHLPKARCALEGGEAVYITLDNLIQIGIFLTGFATVILSILSFNKKK